MDKFSIARQQINKIALNAYSTLLEYIDKNKEYIRKLPKLYFLANGKSGWLDSWSDYCHNHCTNIIDNYYIDCDSLKICYGLPRNEHYINNSKDKIELMKKILNNEVIDFKKEVEKLEIKSNEPIHEIIGMITIRDWFEDSISYGFDISYKEYCTYFKGRINEGYNISENKYDEIVNSMSAEIAKKKLSDHYRINYDVFDDLG